MVDGQRVTRCRFAAESGPRVKPEDDGGGVDGGGWPPTQASQEEAFWIRAVGASRPAAGRRAPSGPARGQALSMRNWVGLHRRGGSGRSTVPCPGEQQPPYAEVRAQSASLEARPTELQHKAASGRHRRRDASCGGEGRTGQPDVFKVSPLTKLDYASPSAKQVSLSSPTGEEVGRLRRRRRGERRRRGGGRRG